MGDWQLTDSRATVCSEATTVKRTSTSQKVTEVVMQRMKKESLIEMVKHHLLSYFQTPVQSLHELGVIVRLSVTQTYRNYRFVSRIEVNAFSITLMLQQSALWYHS